MSFVSSVRGTAAGCDQVQFGAIFAAMVEGTGTPTHRPLRPLTLSETEGETEGVPDGVWWIWNPKEIRVLDSSKLVSPNLGNYILTDGKAF